MGIKQSKAIYITDRGEEYYVEDMQNSHLANTITHIQKKKETLMGLYDCDLLTNEEVAAIAGHVNCLSRDQLTLVRELARRDSCKDEC